VPGTLTRLKDTYTGHGRRLAASSIEHLGDTRLTPTMLTTAGVTLCIVASVITYFEHRAWWLFLVGSAVFTIGSLLDAFDGALARIRGLVTPFGTFLDSTVDRVGEGFMLGAVALVLMRDGNEWGVALAIAAIAGSFLVSYTRAKAEQMGLKGDVGLGSRAERVAIIAIGVAMGSIGALPWMALAVALTSWVTVLQRILAVRSQLDEGYEKLKRGGDPPT
jgi:CDP-diacylglycerol--glycerol-3-phosphate 3-phosphatidyltransferase